MTRPRALKRSETTVVAVAAASPPSHRAAQIQLAATVVFAVLGGALGLANDASATSPVALAVAAIAALGTPLGLVLAALALAAGLGTAPLTLANPPAVEAMLTTAFAGLALGALARAIARHLPALRSGPRAVEYAAFAALLLGLTFLIPDGHAHLADASGAVLRWPATIGDPETLARTPFAFEAFVPLSRPSDLLVCYMTPLAFVSAFVLLAFQGGPRTRQFAARLGLLTAALAGAAALIGLGELLLTSPTLEPIALQRVLNIEGSGAGTILALGPVSDASFRLWSRPMVDPVRLIAAICLAVALVPLVGKSLVHKASSVVHPPVLAAAVPATRPSGATFVAAALALGTLACLFASDARPAIVGGLFLGLGALVAGLYGTPSDRLPRYALAATGLLWFWGLALVDRVG